MLGLGPAAWRRMFGASRLASVFRCVPSCVVKTRLQVSACNSSVRASVSDHPGDDLPVHSEMRLHLYAAKPIRMIFTPAGLSRTALLCSDGIWSAGSVGDFAHELFEDVFECNQAACLAVLVD